MLIGVTGGCGYIGSALIPELVKKYKSIEILDIKKPGPALLKETAKSGCTYLPVDVADPASFREVARRYDVILHLAALVGYPACNRDPKLAVRSNVETTESIMTFKRPDACVLFASTISNYGAQSTRVDENTPTNPNSIYGKTKKQAEELIQSDAANIIFRFAGAFGVAPIMRNDNLIHDFVSRAVAGETISVYESHFVRQFIHVKDMVGAMCFAIDNWDQMRGEIYNVGNSDIEITKRDLVETIARFHDFEYRFEASGTDAEARNYPISFEKLAKVGFRAKHKLEPAIVDIIHYYQQHYQTEHKNAG